MTQMASEVGLPVAKSFNADYDTYLPKTRGHVILIETHHGVPIVPAETLEAYFPGTLAGAADSSGKIQIQGTTIIFVEFSIPLQGL